MRAPVDWRAIYFIQRSVVVVIRVTGIPDTVGIAVQLVGILALRTIVGAVHDGVAIAVRAVAYDCG
jgi:hypothetical protein